MTPLLLNKTGPPRVGNETSVSPGVARILASAPISPAMLGVPLPILLPIPGGLCLGAEAILRMSLLARREGEVLRALVKGDSNKIIAFTLGISPRTVEVHRAHMMVKLGVRRFAEAVRIAVIAGAGKPGA